MEMAWEGLLPALVLALSLLVPAAPLSHGLEGSSGAGMYTLAVRPGDWAEYEVRRALGAPSIADHEVSAGDTVKYVIADTGVMKISSYSVEVPINDVYVDGVWAGRYKGFGEGGVPPVFFPTSEGFWEDLEAVIRDLLKIGCYPVGSCDVRMGDVLVDVEVDVVPIGLHIRYQIHRATGIAVNFTLVREPLPGQETPKVLTMILVNSSRPEAVDLDGPAISVVKVRPEEPGPGDEVLVEARVEDPSGVRRALLSYRCGAGWENTTMEEVDGLFRATIPPQPVGSTVVFKIYAEDERGNWAVSEERSYKVRGTPMDTMPKVGLFIGGGIAIAAAAFLVVSALRRR